MVVSTGLPPAPSRVYTLSERQRECLLLVAKRLTSKEIARRLGLSPSTVDNHIKAAVDKMGAANRGQAASIVAVEGGDGGARAGMPDSLLPDLPAQSAATPDSNYPASSWRLPPLGGEANRLGPGRRLFHIVQIALLGTMALAALTVTIAGLVHLFLR